MSAAFHSMRGDLIARGLLSPELRLTEAGNAHTEQLIEELTEVVAENDSSGPRVQWNLKGRGLPP